MSSRFDLAGSARRRCTQHKLVLQRDGKCALCRAPARSGSSRSITLGLLAAGVVALGAFAFDALRVPRATPEHVVGAGDATNGTRATPRTTPSEPARALAPNSAAAPRASVPPPAEDQFLRTAPAPNEQSGESPPPPRAYVETEPSAPDSPQDFTLPRDSERHAQR